MINYSNYYANNHTLIAKVIHLYSYFWHPIVKKSKINLRNESWAKAVEWALTNDEYHKLGTKYNNLDAKNYNYETDI